MTQSKAYYNENDPYVAEWLRRLIAGGHIAGGDVDERSIVDVRSGDLKGYTQHHFFAGLGLWSLALRLAGWPDDKPVWTGSCPCQPFSNAGKQKAHEDPRHLWPIWGKLIKECRPDRIFGEQVEGALRHGWLDTVYTDLEKEGYACGAAVLGAHSVGAPHIRQRLWWVADSVCDRVEPASCGRMEKEAAPHREDRHLQGERLRPGIESPSDGLGYPHQQGLQRYRYPGECADKRSLGSAGSSLNWHNAVFLPCSDGKERPVPQSVFQWMAHARISSVDMDDMPATAGHPLAKSTKGRTQAIKAFGNAINPYVAATFIMASEDCI